MQHLDTTQPMQRPPRSIAATNGNLDQADHPGLQQIASKVHHNEQMDGAGNAYLTIDLHRGNRGFGFSIRGGQEFNNMPLFVLRIADDGAARLDGRLLVGDQIIEINGVTTHLMTHAQAIDIIKHGGQTVRLLIKRNARTPNGSVSSTSTLPTVSTSNLVNGYPGNQYSAANYLQQQQQQQNPAATQGSSHPSRSIYGGAVGNPPMNEPVYAGSASLGYNNHSNSQLRYGVANGDPARQNYGGAGGGGGGNVGGIPSYG